MYRSKVLKLASACTHTHAQNIYFRSNPSCCCRISFRMINCLALLRGREGGWGGRNLYTDDFPGPHRHYTKRFWRPLDSREDFLIHWNFRKTANWIASDSQDDEATATFLCRTWPVIEESWTFSSNNSTSERYLSGHWISIYVGLKEMKFYF